MRIYVAGPYTKGDVAQNVRNAIKVCDTLLNMHHAPFCPHLTHFWHMLFPRDYEDWLLYDEEWLLMCQAVVRIPGESLGADREVALAKRNNIPVFYGLGQFE